MSEEMKTPTPDTHCSICGTQAAFPQFVKSPFVCSDCRKDNSELAVEKVLLLTRELNQANARVDGLKELHSMQLVAVMTASQQNTETSIKERISKDNPYWTVAYSDVCTAIDREIKLQSTIKTHDAISDNPEKPSHP